MNLKYLPMFRCVTSSVSDPSYGTEMIGVTKIVVVLSARGLSQTIPQPGQSAVTTDRAAP